MSSVVCAIRGGPHSQFTIETAIKLAKQTDSSLHFLYVVDLNFLEQTIMLHKDAVSDELKQMGEFILLMAQEKAATQGIEAKTYVRRGIFLDELIALCLELQANHIVLGRPESRASHLSVEQLEAIQHRIELATQSRVIWAGENAT